MSAETVDLAVVEERIMELCRRAKTELGWKFSRAQYASSGGVCGCALEACATVLELPMLFLGRGEGDGWPNWSGAGLAVGMRDPIAFGAAFDRTIDGEEREEGDEQFDHSRLGQLIALRIMKELTP